MTDDRLRPARLPVMDEFNAALEGRSTFDRFITEKEARELLPELLLQAESLGITAPDFGSAVSITDGG